jgi:hypothetical protein
LNTLQFEILKAVLQSPRFLLNNNVFTVAVDLKQPHAILFRTLIPYFIRIQEEKALPFVTFENAEHSSCLQSLGFRGESTELLYPLANSTI